VKITHIINTLELSGAELMLFHLLSCLPRSEFDSDVIALRGPGPVGEKIASLGIETSSLGLGRNRPALGGVPTLIRRLRSTRPDLVHTWMYHANLSGGIAAAFAGRIPVVWGIHHNDPNSRFMGQGSRLSASLSSEFSSVLARRIICVSESCRRAHVRFGYAEDRSVVIPNGVDTSVYRPDPAAREDIRREFRIPDDAITIGVVGRFDPAKNHRGFFRAVERLPESSLRAHLLLCGRDVDWKNEKLVRWIDASGMADQCTLAGERDDVPRLMNAIDIGCLPSRTESFGLVVAEMMACGVPCVVTDVGAAAEIVSDTGITVPPDDSDALAQALLDMASLDADHRRRRAVQARDRIEARFGLSMMADAHAALYRDVASTESEAGG
jgi:glycosyltransferase involved in cell wall biosynthesis